MASFPEFSTFEARYAAGEAQVVWTTLVSDLETPVSAMYKLADGRPNSFLLESVSGGATRGRYSILGLKPDVIWRCHGDQAEINRQALVDRTAFIACPDDPLTALRALLRESRIDLPDNLPPMAAALVGYLGYDMVRLIEHIPDSNPDTLGIPDGLLIRPTVMAIFDTVLDVVTVVTPVWPDPDMRARAAYARAEERLADIIADLDRPHSLRREQSEPGQPLPEPDSNTSRDEYHDIVRRAKDFIVAGDIYQVVPSQRFELPFSLPPFAFYRALRRTNPSPFLFFFDFGDFAVIGSSPEILVRLRDGKVVIRPIAGTRKRGATPAEDEALAAELLADPKELAEHLMLLDLGRNDVGRVAKIGTVRVTEQMTIERYSHVMHMVSGVNGRLDCGRDAFDLFAAAFPAGTLVGAPKVRAMQIIDELEPVSRGLYGGTVGYFGARGDMDHAITIRTLVFRGDEYSYQAGAGLVADSVPESEYEEVLAKSAAMARALEMAREGF